MAARMESVKVTRLRKAERRAQILAELRLRPHVRIAHLAEQFAVSTETVRRDMEALDADGLVSRAHGGASASAPGQFPSFDERERTRAPQRERIGRCAAQLVQPGEAVMIDSGSTTLQMAKYLALEGTPCTVLTNSLSVAMALGQGGRAEVILCPGDYLPSEAAVTGADTVEYIARHSVDRCLIGASALSPDGPSESVRGFAAIKRAMLTNAATAHLLIDAEKFGRRGLAHVAGMRALSSIITDAAPRGVLAETLSKAGVDVLVAER